MKKLTIFVIIIDTLIVACFLLCYGSVEFRNTIVSTALVTKTHQYIAYTFYSEETVNEIAQLNSYIVPTEEVDVDAIVIDTKEKDSYENEYDEAVLTRDAGNDDYKLIEFETNGYKAFLVAIYDPSKVNLITAPAFNTGGSQETVLNMCARLKGTVCINGGAFVDNGWGSDIPIGYLIKDGKVIWSDSEKAGNLIGFTYDNKLILTKSTGEEALAMGVRDAMEFGPFLIVNGEKIASTNAVGGYDRAARVAIGQRKDGVVLFLVTEGTHGSGANMIDIANILEQYGAYNAANLDGGTSSSLVVNGKLINTPINVYGQVIGSGRRVVSGFGLILN